MNNKIPLICFLSAELILVLFVLFSLFWPIELHAKQGHPKTVPVIGVNMPPFVKGVVTVGHYFCQKPAAKAVKVTKSEVLAALNLPNDDGVELSDDVHEFGKCRARMQILKLATDFDPCLCEYSAPRFFAGLIALYCALLYLCAVIVGIRQNRFSEFHEIFAFGTAFVEFGLILLLMAPFCREDVWLSNSVYGWPYFEMPKNLLIAAIFSSIYLGATIFAVALRYLGAQKSATSMAGLPRNVQRHLAYLIRDLKKRNWDMENVEPAPNVARGENAVVPSSEEKVCFVCKRDLLMNFDEDVDETAEIVPLPEFKAVNCEIVIPKTSANLTWP